MSLDEHRRRAKARHRRYWPNLAPRSPATRGEIYAVFSQPCACDNSVPPKNRRAAFRGCSSDESELKITSLTNHDNSVILVNFSRHFGKEAALFAGLIYATESAVIPIDVVLQAPTTVISEMLERHAGMG